LSSSKGLTKPLRYYSNRMFLLLKSRYRSRLSELAHLTGNLSQIKSTRMQVISILYQAAAALFVI